MRRELTLSGTPQASKTYDPFGQPYNETGSWKGSFAFTGEQRNVNGLQYHRARYYNAGLGAWVSEDPQNPRPRSDADGPNAPKKNPCDSFSADTLVALEDGQKPIAEVRMGDIIMGYSEGEDTVNVFHVTAVHAQEHERTLDLVIAGETVHTTEEHPFFVKDMDWVEAGKLTVGDLVRRGDDLYGIVEVVLIIDEPQVMRSLFQNIRSRRISRIIRRYQSFIALFCNI